MDGDTGGRGDEDPGWHIGWHTLLFLIPGMGVRYARSPSGDGLVNLRAVYLSFPASLILFGVIVPLLVPFRVDRTVFGWVLIILGVAAATSVATRAMEKPLSCDALAEGYRTRMFLRIAFADTTALVGFVAAFTTMSSWLYYLAVLLSLPGLMRAAPTKAVLIREQDDLTASGCGNSLVTALRQTPPKR